MKNIFFLLLFFSFSFSSSFPITEDLSEITFNNNFGLADDYDTFKSMYPSRNFLRSSFIRISDKILKDGNNYYEIIDYDEDYFVKGDIFLGDYSLYNSHSSESVLYLSKIFFLIKTVSGYYTESSDYMFYSDNREELEGYQSPIIPINLYVYRSMDVNFIKSCPVGESLDPDTKSCYKDCTDKDKNKFGFKDGSCIDCSASRGFVEIASCICTGLGSSYSKSTDKDCQYVEKNNKYACARIPIGNFIETNCANNQQIFFKFELDDTQEKDKKPKDDNKIDLTPKKESKDQSNIDISTPNSSSPSGGNSSDSSSPSGDSSSSSGGNSSDSSSPSGDSSSSSGDSSSSSGDSSSSSGGNSSSINENIAGNHNGKEDGIEFGKSLDYSDLNYANNNFLNDIKKGINEIDGKFDNYLEDLNKLKNLFDTQGLTKLQKSSIPNSCSKSFDIPLGFKNHNIKIDLCNFLSEISPLMYKIFYITFFIVFFFICVKLFIFSF